MILTFSKERFKYSYKAGIKKHSFRDDPTNRWKAGMSIQMWLHNPRNYNSHPDIHCFSDKEHCVSVQLVHFDPYHQVLTVFRGVKEGKEVWDKISDVEQVAINDGFDSTRMFWYWFDKEKTMKCIHWTDLKY